jgi:hypothetical protein
MAKIAERIRSEEIVAVFLMSEIVLNTADKLLSMNYYERVDAAEKEYLMFVGINDKLLYRSVLFDNDLLACKHSYFGQINNITRDRLFNWGSIELAFKEKYAKKT